MALIKVRAIKDGIYANYYRTGPIELQDGNVRPGEVFEVEDAPYDLKDEQGRPIYELDENGKRIPVIAQGGKQKINASDGKPMFKVKTASFFSAEWMERVNDDAEVTHDYPPFTVLPFYREKKNKNPTKPVPVVAMPQAVSTESPI